MAPSATHEEQRSSSQKPDKKHKRDKSEQKKRPREEDETAAAGTTPRKPKKAKSEGKSKHAKSEEFVVDSDSDGEAIAAPAAAPATPVTPITPSTTSTKKEKKKKSASKEKRSKDDDNESRKEPKKSKKHKKSQEEESQHVTRTKKVAEAEDMDVDLPDLSIRTKERRTKEPTKEIPTKELTKEPRTTNKMATAEVPTDVKFPFYTQTFSMFVPIFPVGFDKPVTAAAEQHLEPLINHYSTTLKCVLLRYSNVSLSDRPTEGGPSIPTTDKTPTLLLSRDEYGVGLGWLTFDAYIFKPAPGKWMEGEVQFQNDGYIGVLCWKKFNASIEARRLPSTWKWIDLNKQPNESSPRPSSRSNADSDSDSNAGASGDKRSAGDMVTGAGADADAAGLDSGVVEQIHTTGYWVDELGRKISGKLRFRITKFDVGLAGEHGYLSLEGTFLDDDAERALFEEECQERRRRRAAVNPTGELKPQTRRMPEFSVTRFGKDEEDEVEDAQARVVYQRSRPVTPDS